MSSHKSLSPVAAHESREMLERGARPENAVPHLNYAEEVREQNRELFKELVRDCSRRFKSTTPVGMRLNANVIRLLLKKMSEVANNSEHSASSPKDIDWSKYGNRGVLSNWSLAPICQVVWDYLVQHKLDDLNSIDICNFDFDDLPDFYSQ